VILHELVNKSKYYPFKQYLQVDEFEQVAHGELQSIHCNNNGSYYWFVKHVELIQASAIDFVTHIWFVKLYLTK